MRVLVTGAKGQLGYDVCNILKENGIEHCGTDISDFDITDGSAVTAYMNRYRPDTVIHCAAYTAVDRAEEERDICFAVNTAGTCNLAKACASIGAKIVYVSTDYVFSGDGQDFYETYDETNPINIYGASKLAGERAIKENTDKFFIVRVSWLFGRNGNNFVNTMLRLAENNNKINVVCDQYGSPTYSKDLAELLFSMILTSKYGTYHATNEGVCSWADFAREIFRLSEKNVEVNNITSDQYPSAALRPKNSRLSKNCLDRAGFERLPHWKDALARYITGRNR
jgi:dTDP-4-dehydrorhamnose reductase